MPTAIPGVAEAEAAAARSSVERRLRPGSGYFARSPQSRSAPVARPVAPMVQPGSAIVRAPQLPQSGVVIQQPRVMQQPGVVIQQPGVVNQPRVLIQQPMASPPTRWITVPQR